MRQVLPAVTLIVALQALACGDSEQTSGGGNQGGSPAGGEATGAASAGGNNTGGESAGGGSAMGGAQARGGGDVGGSGGAAIDPHDVCLNGMLPASACDGAATCVEYLATPAECAESTPVAACPSEHPDGTVVIGICAHEGVYSSWYYGPADISVAGLEAALQACEDNAMGTFCPLVQGT